jgi:hypothetical protein
MSMVAVKEITWEEVSAPDFGSRAVWREAVAEIAEKAKAKLPECSGRVDAAVKIVLAGDVALQADGTAHVASQSNGSTAYHVVNGHCDCKDFAKAPHGFCKHRLSAAIARRAQELVKAKLADTPSHEASGRAGQPDATRASLPEAPASINVRLMLHGRECQLTLRDSDEAPLLERLAVVLQQYPVKTKPIDTIPQCPTHGPMKPGTKGKGWYCPTRLPDGSWCKGK